VSYSVLIGDNRDTMQEIPDETVQTVVTSPPYYGLRDYGVDGQIGLEETPEEYVQALVDVFREVRRVLRDDGTVWLNLGDSYNAAGRNGHGTRVGYKQSTNRASAIGDDHSRANDSSLKEKDLIGIPWRVAFALQSDGWYLRQDIIWQKPNSMPESVTDRCTKAHEYLFLLTKNARYFYDAEAVKEPAICGHNGSSFVSEYDIATKRRLGQAPRPSQKKGSFGGKWTKMDGNDSFRAVVDTRNRRSVWTVATQPYSGAHFATFPPKLIEPCILAGSKLGDVVFDPFGGSGTTAAVAIEHGRKAILCELSPAYAELIPDRINSITDALTQGRLFQEAL